MPRFCHDTDRICVRLSLKQFDEPPVISLPVFLFILAARWVRKHVLPLRSGTLRFSLCDNWKSRGMFLREKGRLAVLLPFGELVELVG